MKNLKNAIIGDHFFEDYLWIQKLCKVNIHKNTMTHKIHT